MDLEYNNLDLYLAINSIALCRSTSITSIAPDPIKASISISPMHSLHIKTDVGLSANLLEGSHLPPFWVGFIAVTKGLSPTRTDTLQISSSKKLKATNKLLMTHICLDRTPKLFFAPFSARFSKRFQLSVYKLRI